MAFSLTVTSTGLRIRLTGFDRVAAGTHGLDVPFGRIVGSRVMTREDAVASSPHLPCPGCWWPGRLRTGSWGVGDRRQLWAVHDGAAVVVVYLSGRPFHRLVVEAEEPTRVHRRIEAALLYSKTIAARRSLRGTPPRVADSTGDDGS